MQCKAALLRTMGKAWSFAAQVCSRSWRGERGICPSAGKTHCLRCSPPWQHSSLPVVKPNWNSLQGCANTHSLCCCGAWPGAPRVPAAGSGCSYAAVNPGSQGSVSTAPWNSGSSTGTFFRCFWSHLASFICISKIMSQMGFWCRWFKFPH